MKYLRKGGMLVAGIAALALSSTAGAVNVSLVGDANPDELQVVISGLGTAPATDVSAFDIGMNFSGLTLTAANMSLNLSVLDDGGGFFASCAMGSDGSTAASPLGGCPGSTPGGVTADLAFTSFDSDATLAGIQNPTSAASFSLTLATLDFSGPVLPAQITLVWDDGFHDVKGANQCNPDGVTGVGNGQDACIIYNPKSTSVPEPGTLALLGLGILGAATLRRRSR